MLVDSKVGMTWGAAGPSSAQHVIGDQTILLNNSLLLGQSVGNAGNCDQAGSTSLAFSWPASKPQAAVLLPIFVTAHQGWPGWGEYGEACETDAPRTASRASTHTDTLCVASAADSEITYANFMAGSYPQLFGEVRVTNSTILRYGLASGCGNGRQSNVFENIEAAADANYPQFFSGITTDASSRQNISLFTPPKREWITIDDCVAMGTPLGSELATPGSTWLGSHQTSAWIPCTRLRRSQARPHPRPGWHAAWARAKCHADEQG